MVISLSKDANRITVIGGTSSVDGVTPVAIYVDPTTHRLKVDASSTANITIGTSTITGGTSTRVLYDNAGVVGEYLITGSGTTAVLNNTPTLLTPVFTGLPTGSGVDSAATASTLASRDASANLSANNNILGYTTTTTSASTTTLTVASTYLQFFTGSTTQGCKMPVTSTLTLGHQFRIVNNSTGAVTVQSSGGNTIVVIGASTSVIVTCILTSGTNAASWSFAYAGANLASGKVATINNSITFAGTDSTTMTFPSTSKTILANDLSNIGTAVSNLIFTDNTFDIGASGATRPRTGYFGTSIVSPVVNATTGVQINGAATLNKILKGDGTNFVASTETYATPGTSGNVMTSDGTNWTSATPSSGGQKMNIFIDALSRAVNTLYTFANAGSGGQSASGDNPYAVSTGGTGTSYANATFSLMADTDSNLFNNSPSWSCILKVSGDTTQTGTGFVGIGNLTITGTSLTLTGDHIGFKIVKAAGVLSLYATQAGGTETASSALTTVAIGDVLSLYFKVNGTSSVDYYWTKNSGAWSSATNLATNVPTGLIDKLQICVTNETTTGSLTLSTPGFNWGR